MKGQTIYYAIKFYSNHYRALRSRYKSRKVGRISSKIVRFRPFFSFLQPLLIRVGPFINMFPLHYISTYYLKCFGVCGSGYYGKGEGRKDTSRFEFRKFLHENTSFLPIFTRK